LEKIHNVLLVLRRRYLIMKKIIFTAGILGIFFTSNILGASIDHVQSLSLEYNANPAQQGAISAGSSPYYNPAGLMQIENGTYLGMGLQYAIGEEKMEYAGKEYKADLLEPIPNISLVAKNDDRAWYWTMGGIGGGGDLEYEDGVAGIGFLTDLEVAKISPVTSVNGNYAEGSNRYFQSTLGRAWFLTDKVSVSAAGRVVYGMRSLVSEADLTLMTGETESISLDSERTAWGYGGQFGLNYKATEKLNIGMRYDTRVMLEFEADADEKYVNSLLGSTFDFLLGDGDGYFGVSDFYSEYADGEKSRRDLPAMAAIGASYNVTDVWTVYLGGNYYFNKDSDMDRESDEANSNYDNGWELAAGSEYWMNEKWAWLVGINYAYTGAPEETYDDVEYALNSLMVGTGVKYRHSETTEWIFSVSNYWYEGNEGIYSSEYEGVTENQNYDKSILAVGVGVTKKF
jgi:long-chain fatty acid transport protein